MLARTARPTATLTASPFARPTAYGRATEGGRVLGPERRQVAEADGDVEPAGDLCLPYTTGQLVCAASSRCICPLAGHVSDAERAVMNDISRQASHLATALAWIFALVALAALVMVVLR